MSAEVILTTALFVAVPVTLKYVLAFEIRTQVARLKAGEREVAGLTNRLAALNQEQGNVRRALTQIQRQRSWAQTRRSLIAQELGHARMSFPRPESTPTSYASVEWEALANG